MPIYQFKCMVCELEFEQLTTLEKKDKVVCLHCGSKEVKDVFSAFATKSSCAPSSSSFT